MDWGQSTATPDAKEPFQLVQLTRGYEVKVSLEDIGWASEYPWHVKVDRHGVYARRSLPKTWCPARQKMIQRSSYLHREVVTRMGFEIPFRYVVDHKNKDTQDCRRSNLRIIDQHANNVNQLGYGAIPYRGVNSERRKYRARIYDHVAEQRLELGYYDTPEQAALAYDEQSFRMFGQFAPLNFPEKFLAIVPSTPETLYDIPF